MKLLRTSFLALLGLAMVATTQAGTYTQGTTTTSAPAPVGGPYLSLAGGALWLDDASYGPVSLDFDTGYSILGAIGYAFGNGLSVELESGYLSVEDAEVDIRGFGNFDVDGEFRQVPIFANVLYTVDVTDVVGVYVGGGAGVVWSEAEIDGINGFALARDLESDSEWNFAAQAKAGVTFRVTDAASLNIGYRFMYGQDAIAGYDDSIGHILEGGLTIRF